MANLGAEMLVDFSSVNSFQYSDNLAIRQGNTYSAVNVQLFDQDQILGYFTNALNQARDPIYLRYMPDPATSPALTVTFSDLNSANVVTKICSQLYTLDPSIWTFALAASETSVMTGGNIQFLYTENGITNTFVVINGLVVTPLSPAQCG